MADVQYFRRSNGQEESALVGDGLYSRLVSDPEWTPIDGEGGDPVELEAPTTEEEEGEGEEVELAIEGYDDLSVEGIVPLLEDLDDEELAAVEAYEIAGKNRKGVLDAIEAARE